MSNEKFVIPKNFTFLQSMELLYTIVMGQYKNLKSDIQREKDYKEQLRLYKKVESLLKYIGDGFNKISKKFSINEDWEVYLEKDDRSRKQFEDFQILDNDIRQMRSNVGMLLSKHDKENNNNILGFLKSKNNNKFVINDESDKILMEKVTKIKQERSRQEKLARLEQEKKEKQAQRQDRERELEKEKLLELRIREHVKTEMNKTLEQERELRQKQLIEKRNRQRKHEEEMMKTRRSLDVPRSNVAKEVLTKTTIIRRNSDSSDAINQKKQLDMNQAAVLAWSAAQKTANHNKSNTNNSNETHRSARRSLPPPLSSDKKISTKNKILVKKQPNSNNKIRVSSSGSSKPIKGRVLSTNGKSSTRERTPPSQVANTSKANTPTTSAIPSELSPLKAKIEHILNTLEGVDADACKQIVNDILIINSKVYWDDIAGLDNAKNSLKEAVIYPFLRPDLFKGLREPIRGMLLFGPPGTGKTMIAKAIATEARTTFFSISASSLLSKYLGESEKLVRALFYLAKRMAPSIIFIDEIDSLLSTRSDNENESSRRIKTELLIQWSNLSSATAREDTGKDSHTDNRVLVLSATNLPWAIDEAARRRFSRRLYIPLPNHETRLYHLKKLMSSQKNALTEEDFEEITNLIDGYSGSDITALAKEAAMEPIRNLGDELMNVDFENIRPVNKQDFIDAMKTIRKSVSPQSLKQYEEWASHFGSLGS